MRASQHVTWKSCEVIPFGPEVISANTLNFKPISGFSLLETVGGPLSDMG